MRTNRSSRSTQSTPDDGQGRSGGRADQNSGMSLRDQATNQLPRVHAPPSTVQDTTYERAQREPASQPGWLRRLLENYRSHDGEGLATAVAFNTLVALVPLMMLVFLAVSLLVQLASVQIGRAHV